MNLKFVKKKDGFTLIELLIVIFIVAILSTLAISGYTSYRRVALLDFTADSLISQLYELKANTVHGDFGGHAFDEVSAAIEAKETGEDFVMEEGNLSEPKCYGLYFNEVEDGIVEVKSFELVYKGTKSRNGDLGSDYWIEETCDYGGLENDENFSFLEKDRAIEFVGVYVISGDNEVSLGEFVITFIPPDGKIETVEGDTLRVVVKSGKSEDDKYKRNIFIDLKSGEAHVTRFADV